MHRDRTALPERGLKEAGMDEDLINPFIDATITVLKTMAFVDVSPGKPYIKRGEVAPGDVSGILGMTGHGSGSLSVSFSGKSILPIVSNMVGETIPMLNDEIKDAVGEITNMISGQARKKLSEIGRPMRATIPTVIMGKNHTISHITNQPVIAVPFTTEDGSFTVEVCFGR